MRQQFGSSAYGHFRNSYSEQDIFRGSDIQEIFEEMAKSFGFRGFDDIFKEAYGKGYRSFQFGKPGFFAKGFVFTGPLNKGGQNNGALPLSGNIAKLSRFVLEKFGGVTLPQNGSDVNDIIRLSPELAYQGGPFAYYNKKRAKKLIVKIPPQVQEGQKIRLAGMGENGKGGGQSGDLYLKVQIKRPVFRRLKEFVSGLGK
jgi:curved DNA-binding protein CbpA